MIEPLVVYFQANVRFEGPAAAVEEWAGSALNMLQLLAVEEGINVVFGVGVGVDGGAGMGVVDGDGDSVVLGPKAQS